MQGHGPVILAIAASILVTCGCSGASSRPAQAPPPPPLVWPGPPAEARIRHAGTVRGPQDVGVPKSFLNRLTETVLGGKTDESFVRPTGVAERRGVLYVADPGAPALWILDAPGRRSVKVDRVGSVELVSPVAVAPGPDEDVFVADSALGRIFRIDGHGALRQTIADQALKRPAGLAYDETTGHLYVADSLAQQIAVYAGDGTALARWGRRGMADGEFNGPTHVGLATGQTILVTDAMNFRIQVFDREGRFLSKMGRHGDGSGDFAAPKGVAVDSLGHVYVVDSLFDAIQIFETDGTLLLAFGERGVEAGRFWLPGGIFVNRQDRIYVADSFNQRIQLFDLLPSAGAHR
jgi:DNA-binding beta-propeller fold protein YncE